MFTQMWEYAALVFGTGLPGWRSVVSRQTMCGYTAGEAASARSLSDPS